MVYLNMRTTCKEVPINDIIATGLVAFFTDLSENSEEFKGQKNLDRFRLLYNGRELNDESLKKISDDDSIRVALLPEIKVKKPLDEAARKEKDSQLAKLAAPYKNPEDRRLHGFNHDFALPDHMSRIMKCHPRLVFDSQFVSVLNDWYLFRAYCIRNSIKHDPNRGMFKYTNPEFLEVFKNVMALIGQRYGFSEQMGGARIQASAAPPRALAGGPPQPITQAFLQNALQAALAQVNLPQPAHRPAAAAPPPRAAPAPAPAPAPQPAEEPMHQGYEQQAALLREYGFENNDLIQLALEQTDGNVEAAIELIIELQSQ